MNITDPTLVTNRDRQSGSTVVIVLIILVVMGLISFNLLKSAENANPWRLKSNKYKAVAFAENAIILKKFDDLEPKPQTDSLDGDSIIVGSGGYAPDTSLQNIMQDMHRILISSKEVLPEVEADTVGMWLRYIATGLYRGQSRKVTIHYGRALSNYFRNALLITGDKTIEGASSSNILGTFLSKHKADPEAEDAAAQFVTSVTGGMIRYANGKYSYLKSEYNSTLEENEDVFSATSSYSRKEELLELDEIVIPGGDLTIEITDESLLRLPKLELIVVEGQIEITGKIDLSNCAIYASGQIIISDAVRGKGVTLYSKERIELKDSVSFQGLILSEGDIVLDNKSSVTDNSLLITAGAISLPEQGEGSIYIKDEAQAHGMIISAAMGGPKKTAIANVYIESDIEVTGVVFAKGAIDNQGTITGSAVAQTMACDGEKNCFGFGTIDRESLGGFYQPIDMRFQGDGNKLVISRWRQERGESE